jgi:Tol biopolymer transport system component
VFFPLSRACAGVGRRCSGAGGYGAGGAAEREPAAREWCNGRVSYRVSAVIAAVISALAAICLAGASPGSSAQGWCAPRHCLVFAARGDIYSVNEDGSGIVRLTTDSADDFSPSWSADGTVIAFRSDRTGTDAIFLMNADGSNVRQWKLPGHPEGLVWAPNGRKIAYSGGARDDENTNGDIWVINADGTGYVRVSGRPGYTNEFPSWSPDSRRIAYASTQAVRADDHSLWIVNADGSRRRRLSPAGRHSSWNPNGHGIVFARAGADGRRRLWLVSPNGKRRHRLSAVVAEFPAWSPDGRRIAYAAVSGGIGFIDTRGRPQKRIATALGQVGWPTWRPAASRLKHASTPTSRREED